jgi:endonuclease/exonuclease/phosphatase family metal-dependent hydrolase
VSVVREAVKKCDTPLVFMGDLNIEPTEEFYADLSAMLCDTADLGEGEMHTFPSHEPDRKIDYIFVNGQVGAISTAIPNVVASDHRPCIARISF